MRGEIPVFFTGGTIGMSPAEGSPGVAPAGNFEALLQGLAKPPEGVRLVPVEWADKPSPHMTPEDMFRLSRDVDEALARPETLGAVILHGTDVLLETAWLLDLTVASDKPVVFTGAMRYYAEIGFDGLRNLVNAVRACLLPLPPQTGVVLLMTDRIFAARDVVKVNSLNIDAFEAREDGILGAVAGEDIVLSHHAARRGPRRVLPARRLETRVPLVTCYTGMDGAVVDWHREQGIAGLVLEGFGAGNVPPALVDAVQRCLDAGITVALATRCIEGGVWPLYGYPGGGADLASRGVLLSHRLGGPRTRLLLMTVLALGCDPRDIRETFESLAS